MYSITKSLVTLAEELGVKFHYNSRVQEIAVKGKKAVGVKVNGNFVSGDAVVSNMDIWFTYKKLLKDQVSPERILKQERSSSALIFYWAIKKEFRVLDLHNIFFSENYKEELDSIWKEKEIYTDPTVYLNVSSKYKKEDAPPGSENWFVMINVPSNSGQDWDKLISKARQSIQQKLSRILKEDIRSLIIGEAVLDPEGIELKTSSYAGSIYGTSSNSCFSAFLRHANYSSRIKGLYFVGGSVHPGGGIPLALQSARIVSEMIS
jgi:phytoene dehydrogenase-like protein